MPRNLKGRILILGMTAVVMAFGAFACTKRQLAESESQLISEVEVRFVGPNKTDKARIRSFMKSKSGVRYSVDLIDNDMRSLYESGLVDDVSFSTIPSGESVKLVAWVTPRVNLFGPPFCVGNTAFSDVKLKKQSGLQKNSGVTSDELDVACRKLELFYQERGYPNARVSCRANFGGGPPKPDDFIFVIEEGRKTE